jgi:hypothetical protein
VKQPGPKEWLTLAAADLDRVHANRGNESYAKEMGKRKVWIAPR